MNMNELLELQARLWAAKVNKHLIGAASGYADALEREAGPVDYDGYKHSASHLLALVEKVIRVRNAPKAPEKKLKPEPEPKLAIEPPVLDDEVETKVVAKAPPKPKPKG
jgi:hypothetical protein